jgi:glycosyltransferase involved in cell wall biosynthesis
MTPRRLRVMHVIDALSRGGAERLVLTTVTHLDASRYESVVVVLSPLLALRPEFEALGVPVHEAFFGRPVDSLRVVARLVGLMRRYRPDIVHTHLPWANALGRVASAIARVPRVVTTLHATEHAHWSPVSWRARLRKIVDRFGARHINAAIVAVSSAVRDDYRTYLGLDNVHVIYNYVDPAAFMPLSRVEIEDGRGALGWIPDDFVLVSVGRLSWEKGQASLIRALPEIAAAVPNVRLLVVGVGPQLEQLQQLAAELGVAGRVAFTGSRPFVERLLGLADVFVFPSLSEGLGIALLEAMAMGLPVVASSTEGIMEVATDGADALLVPPGEPAAIAAAVVRLHADRAFACRLGEQARKTVAARFSVDRGVSRLDDLYQRLVAA